MAIPKLNDKGRMSDIPLSPEAKITVERRGEIVLIGVNRPQISQPVRSGRLLRPGQGVLRL